MKKEIIAGALLLLIFILSIVNFCALDRWLEELSAQVRQSAELVDRDDRDGAAELLEQSLENWLSREVYTHAMLRHDELDPITDEYYALLDELRSGGDATSASFDTLLSHLRELAEMERPSLSSIF